MNIDRFMSDRQRMGGAICILFALLVGILLVSKSASLDREGYLEYRQAIVELRHQEASFGREIWIVRHELFVSYDAIVRNLTEQKALHARLQDIPRFIPSQERQAIAQLLLRRETLLEQVESLSERFKSQNALLKNSLRYLPLLGRQFKERLAREVAPQPRQASLEVATQSDSEEPPTIVPSVDAASRLLPLESEFNALVRYLLLYNIDPDARLVSRIESSIVELSQLQPALDVTESEFPVQLAQAHAKIVLAQKPQLDTLKAQMLLPLEGTAEELEATFDRAYQQAAGGADRARTFAYLWLSVLSLALGYWLARRLQRRRSPSQVSGEQLQPIATAIAALPDTGNLPALNALAARNDAIGRLASETCRAGERLRERQEADTRAPEPATEPPSDRQSSPTPEDRESLSLLTAYLVLLTQKRQKILSPPVAQRLEALAEETLSNWNGTLLDLQHTAEQVQLRFSYPPYVSLSQLITAIKTDAAIALGREFPEIDSEAVWSRADFVASCDSVLASRVSEMARASFSGV